MKRVDADVVIVSAGTAGLAAAIAAAERGAKVIAFEKTASTGGTANRANGLFAVESRLQHLKQMTLTREEAFRIYMDFTHWKVNARLVKAFIDKSASTIDWLENMGVEFLGLWSHGTGNYYTWHVIKGQYRGPGQLACGATAMKIMTRRAKELGVEIFLGTPVNRILIEGDRIIGVMAKDRSKEDIKANAKAVILACGGFGGHFQTSPAIAGDGIRMAREVGADAIDMETGMPSGAGGLRPLPSRSANTVPFTFRQAALMVNLSGERFMNEEVMTTTPFGNNAVARQKNQTAFTIFDEITKNHYVEEGLDFPTGFGLLLTKATNFDAEFKNLVDQGSNNLFVADSLEELASKIGINSDNLHKTIDEYNLACETGRDDLFAKKARYLRPVKKPKFYASKSIASPHVSGRANWGGIEINHKTEVLTKDRNVIPGLYAVGMEAACSIYYEDYPNVLPATAMGFAINSGRIAGENAA